MFLKKSRADRMLARIERSRRAGNISAMVLMHDGEPQCGEHLRKHGYRVIQREQWLHVYW